MTTTPDTPRLPLSTRRRLLAGVAGAGAAVALSVPLALAQTGARHGGPVPGNANIKLGKTLFVAACGSCHMLKAAGTTGRKGPNLAREPSAYAAILTRIRYGGEGMPAFGKTLTKAQVRDIAAYVARVTPYSGGVDD